MKFYGADTQALREQAEATQRGAQALDSSGHCIAAAVAATSWEGPDAAAFRLRSALVRQQLEQATKDLSAFGTLLRQEAEEQDQCSSADGYSGGMRGLLKDGTLFDLLGRFPLFGIGNSATRSAGIGFDNSDQGSGTVFADSMTSKTAYSGGSSQPAPHPRIEDEDFKVATPESDTDASGELHGVGAKGEFSPNSSKLTLAEEDRVLRSMGPLDAEFALSRSSSVETITHEDGSVTFVFETSVKEGVKVGADGKVVDGEVSISAGTTHGYSVTMPPGSTLAEAAAIDPFEPNSLPPGSSVTIENSLSAEAGAKAGVTYRGVRAGVDATVTVEHSEVTTMSKGEDGTLTVDSGPGTALGVDGGFSVGVDGVAGARIGPSGETATTVTEHVEFTSDDAGAAAAREAMLSGVMPDDTGGHVLERYTDTREIFSGSASVEAQVGNEKTGASGGVAEELIAREKITRDHPDGHQEWEERGYPRTGGQTAWVSARGETGEPTTYMLDVGSSNAGLDDTYPETIDLDPSTHEDPARIAYTEEEVRQMMDHQSPEGDEPFDYLLDRAGEGSGGAERMYYDYKHIDTAEQERLIEAGEVDPPPGYTSDRPGQILEPGETSTVVRGKGEITTAGEAPRPEPVATSA